MNCSRGCINIKPDEKFHCVGTLVRLCETCQRQLRLGIASDMNKDAYNKQFGRPKHSYRERVKGILPNSSEAKIYKVHTAKSCPATHWAGQGE